MTFLTERIYGDEIFYSLASLELLTRDWNAFQICLKFEEKHTTL